MRNAESFHKEALLVSIVVPTYNRELLLPDMIKSVIAQTYKHWELIIVDDRSTDNTSSILATYCLNEPRIRFQIRPSQSVRGANTCRNLGLAFANGDVVKFLDSDDILNEDCLGKQINALEANAADVCFCQANFFHLENNGERSHIKNRTWGNLRPKSESVLDEYLKGKLRWQTASGLWRKEFLPVKPFKEGLANSQEWLMHLHMLVRHPRISFIDDILVHVRVHKGSMSNAANKKGKYYFHQCHSRIEALSLLRKDGALSSEGFNKIFRFFIWNHLFTFYKGAWLKGFELFKTYPELFVAFFAARQKK